MKMGARAAPDDQARCARKTNLRSDPGRINGDLRAAGVGVVCGAAVAAAQWALAASGGVPYEVFFLPFVLLPVCGLIAGLCLRLVVARIYTLERTVLATPAIYWHAWTCMLMLVGGDVPSMFALVVLGIIALAAFAASWPFTWLSFVILNPRYRLVTHDATCVQCGYNLTGNVSGICVAHGSRSRRLRPGAPAALYIVREFGASEMRPVWLRANRCVRDAPYVWLPNAAWRIRAARCTKPRAPLPQPQPVKLLRHFAHADAGG